jgi:sodium/bile acid cotransporter 7
MAKLPKPSFSIDPFLLCLIAVVTAASLLPVRGVAAAWVDGLADVAIALLFFLHGAKLSRAAIVQGIGNWRLHGLVFASTYVLFPAVGLALVAGLRGWANPLLLSGLLYLTLLPSTVQSSIAFTAIARGNVAAAVCSASLSNLVGIFLTPLLVALFLQVDTGGAGGGFSWHSVGTIALQLLAPFLAGHFLRPLIGGFIDRNKKILMPVDRGSILLVVYSAFSAAVVNGIWTRVGAGDLLMLLVLSALVLAVVMGVNVLAARAAGLPREDGIVLLFCGSKKSLVSGVPMAGALFAPAHVGLIVLPLMIFHQLQLFLCAVLAGRFQREAIAAEASATLPRTEAGIAAAAAAVGVAIPEACMPGVVANMALLDKHAGNLRG